MLILVITLLGVAPSILIMMTSFSRIIIVLSLTRNALGLQGIPPNQILIGLALFLSLFVMAPTLSEINDVAFQPYLDGQLEQGDAFDAGSAPLREFMLEQTRTAELEMMLDARGGERPEGIDDLGLDVVVPAFILSELRTAFTIGFVLFIPFLVVDLVVSAVLMSLGMMMLPPVFVSLPFKLLLFVMVGGWTLLVETLLSSFV
ncbi:MAG: flagellar type III secretion system pore protein FliP [Actinomycetia bacterium]|nr:flagellar type III secretion system pore protein FliP [Actinomycetes bacterium]MCP4085650.1 flagellar type III secretion system pore protein FliP [Actinomycetes bacterium]